MGRHRTFDEAEVIASAMELFWSNGFHETSPRQLVEATGLSKSSLYATFGSKEGIFLAALERYIERQVTTLRLALSEGTLRQGLDRLSARLVAVLSDGPNTRACLLTSASLQLSGDNERARSLTARGHEAMIAVLEERISKAIEDGELAQSEDPATLARCVITVNMGLQVLARTESSPEHLAATAARALDNICPRETTA